MIKFCKLFSLFFQKMWPELLFGGRRERHGDGEERHGDGEDVLGFFLKA